MKAPVALLVGLLSLASRVVGELPSLPAGVPPLVGSAEAILPSTVDDGGVPRISLVIPKIRWQQVGEVVPKKEWPELAARTEWEKLDLRLDGPSALSPSRVVDLAGNELQPDKWAGRMKGATPVLVSVSGKMPDRYYLRLAKPETMIIILGPRDGAPLPALLPAETDTAVEAK